MAAHDIKAVLRALKDQGWAIEQLDASRQKALHPSGSIVFISGRMLERRALMNTISDLRRTGHFVWPPPDRHARPQAVEPPATDAPRAANPIAALVDDVAREVFTPNTLPGGGGRDDFPPPSLATPSPPADPIDRALLLFREARDYYALAQDEADTLLAEKIAADAEYDRILGEIEAKRDAAGTRYNAARKDVEEAARGIREAKEGLDRVLMAGVPDDRKPGVVVSVTDARADRSAGVRRG